MNLRAPFFAPALCAVLALAPLLGPDTQAATALPRPRITGIAHAAFYVSDMAKARAFYEGFLGYESPFSIPRKDPAQRLVWIKINDRQSVELFPGSEVAPDSDRLYHIAVETDDAEAMRLYLQSKGVAVPPASGIGKVGNKNYFVKDPNGNTVEIVQYLPATLLQTDRPRTCYSADLKKRPVIPRLDGGPQTILLVEDVERSVEFYRDSLRLEMNDGDAERYAEFDAGDSGVLLLVKREGSIAPMAGTLAGGQGSALSFSISADGYAIWKQWLEKRGVTIDRETRWIHGGRSLYVLDPDGRRLEFKTPPVVAPPAPKPAAKEEKR